MGAKVNFADLYNVFCAFWKKKIFYDIITDYFLHSLYHWSVDDNTVITPNVLMIYMPNAPVEFQGGFRVEHNEIFWWGVSMRARQSLMLSAGVNIDKKFTIGYSFDIYRTPLSVYDAGSSAHEVLLRYNFLK